ncbi:MAG: branched-chain amino acid ABC transporter ATP-binding protein/permease [Pseudomonadota bacterium]|nr:branched-chain amino acid ABC transporter ATP-binding protein/permease [Pseudomonadota bacterium]
MLIVLGAALIASILHSSYVLDVFAYAMVLGIFALGVSITFGQLGLASFGHAAFLGLGAYTAGLLTETAGLNYWLTIPLAIVPGLLLGALLGFASARLSGAYFAIATLVVAEIFVLAATNWTDLTRGPMGLLVTVQDAPFASIVGWNAQQAYLFVLLVTISAVLVALRNLRASATGRAWAAIRAAPALAESLGISTVRYRVLNVAISGGVSALAGALLVPKVFVLSPNLFGAQYSATGLLSVILGGKATLFGPVLGGVLFAVLPEGLRFLGELNFAAFAALLILAVRLLPQGIVGQLVASTRRRHDEPMQAVPSGVVPPSMDGATPLNSHPIGPVLLSVANVSRHFSGLKAVDDVAFEIHEGEIVGLIGPNGAGKTTMLTMLSGFLSPSHGDILAFGKSVGGVPANIVARRGTVRTFQQTVVCGELSVLDNVLIAAHLAQPRALFRSILRTPKWALGERRRQAHALASLEAVGMDASGQVIAGSLPYGEQKLLGVAMALAVRPRVLLLDEPAAGLNQVEAARLAGVLRKLRVQGLTLLVVDHNLKMLMSMVDRVIVMHHGQKLADGVPAEVVARSEVIAAYLGKAADATPGERQVATSLVARQTIAQG